MTNWNPSFNTRFKPGYQPEGRGSRKGIKDRITKKFLQDFAADLDEHGAATIARVRQENPVSYVKMALALAVEFEKESQIERPLDGFTDQELERLVAIGRMIRASIEAEEARLLIGCESSVPDNGATLSIDQIPEE